MAKFNGGNKHVVHKVEIKNRGDCCGQRLALTIVMIGNVECGKLPKRTENGKWYTVTCTTPIQGGMVKLITQRNEFLSIAGIRVHGAGQVQTVNNGPKQIKEEIIHVGTGKEESYAIEFKKAK